MHETALTVDSVFFKQIMQFIQNEMGVATPAANYSTILHSIAKRCRSLELTPENYLHLLKQDSSEKQLFLNTTTINETYFFREEKQFLTLEKMLFPALDRKMATLKLWSVACSTGEEAYSLAMLAHKFWHNRTDYQVYASDINTDVIAVLRQGKYSDHSFRTDGKRYAALIKEYGIQAEPAGWQILPQVQQHIQVFQANLLLDSYQNLPSDITIAFFRNTLIYIADELRLAVLRKIVGKLAEGGYLFLSAAEVPLVVLPELQLLHYESTYFFQKVTSRFTPQTSPVSAMHKSLVAVIPTRVIQPETTNTLLPKISLAKLLATSRAWLTQQNKLEMLETSSSDSDITEVVTLFLYCLDLIKEGHFSQARSNLQRLQIRLASTELTHYLHGLSYFLENDFTKAQQWLEQAKQVNPTFWPAIFYLAQLLKTTQPALAKQEFMLCHRLLKATKNRSEICYDLLLNNFHPHYFLTVCAKWIAKLTP